MLELRMRLRRVVPALVALAVLAGGPALRAARPRIYALTGATIVPGPGKKIDGGTVVIRDGLIQAVGKDVAVPADAVAIEGKGLYVYAALIDAGGFTPARDNPAPATPAERGRGERREPDSGPVYPLNVVRPERRVVETLQPFDGDRKRDAESWRKVGFAAVVASPTKGVFRGTGAVVLLKDDTPVADLVIREGAGSYVAFETSGFGEGYPTSLMGAAAVMRQTFLDAQRYAVWTERYAKNPVGMSRPDRLPALEALLPVLAGKQPIVLEAAAADDVLLADRIAKEFGIALVAIASGNEAEHAEAIAKTGRTIVVPARIPNKPKVDDPDDALDVSLKELNRYLDASVAPKILRDAGVNVLLSAHGLDNLADFPANVRKIIDAGFPEDAALAALTTGPAELLGLTKTLGTIEPGKIANLVVADGPLFGKDTKVRRVFVDGTDYPVEEKAKPKGDPNAVVDPRGTWSVVITLGGQPVQRTWTIGGEKGKYTGTAETRSGTVTFDKVELAGNALTVTFPASEGRGANDVTVIVTGDSFEGTIELGPRSAPVKGTRTARPEGGAR
jgi:imidazolonepropionase-like amidohydrolase